MAKVKTKWVCQNCGYETPKYIGKCPDCNNWGTLVEEVEIKTQAPSQSVVIDDQDLQRLKRNLISRTKMEIGIRLVTL